MDFSDLFKVLTPAAIGAVVGYFGKTLIEHFLNLRLQRADKLVNLEVEKTKKLEERLAYQSERFYLPLSRSLERLASRLLILVGDKKKEYEYTDSYTEQTAAYEFCCTCYWLEQPELDPLLAVNLDTKTLDQVREILRAVSGLPVYGQKEIARTMTQSDSNRFGPIAYGAFIEVERRADLTHLSWEMKSRVTGRDLGPVTIELSKLALTFERCTGSQFQT